MGSWNKSWARLARADSAPQRETETATIEDAIVTLRDGSRALVRAVRPDDKERLATGFEALSERSRTFRFCAAKRELTEQELRYLTEVDGVDHVAIGAMLLRPGQPPVPAAIARFVRLERGGSVAEAAVVVADELQGKGLGLLLMRRLADAARVRGVTRFRCFVLGENTAMLGLLRALDPRARVLRSVSGTQEVDVPIPRRPRADVSIASPLEALRGRSATSSWPGS